MAYIEWFQDGVVDRSLVGGKGASLARLAGAGFNVPPGFTLTTEAYRQFFEATGLEDRPTEDTVRERFEATPLPDDVAEAVTTAYEQLAATAGTASAVRSSAPSEDGGASSSAGLYESYLNIHGAQNVLDAVKRCYLSLWSARAVLYRGRSGEPTGPEAMAVVIMSLVPSDAAGVAFTAHPVTGDRDVVLINSSWGLGESVVSGAVTPDSFVVRKSDLALLEREVFDKQTATRPDANGSGTTEVALERAQTSACSLADDDIAAVARLACDVESHFDAPQDIEWALADSKLYLLQARPITTL